MKRYEIAGIRNVALIGHGGSGKTSLAESMLFVGGVTKRLGKTDDGTSILNFEPEEKAHKITISTGIASLEYQKSKITLLDTPGYDVFLHDSMCALKAVEAAILVVGADAGGAKFEALRMWKYANELNLPRAVVITKLDKENVSYDKVFENLKNSLNASLVPMQLPIGENHGFAGYVDLMKMKAFTFADDTGKPTEGPVPANLKDEAETARVSMIEGLVETDDKLMEKYFDGQEITDEELKTALKAAFSKNKFVPVFVSNGLRAIGASGLLDFIVAEFPSPADRPPVIATTADGKSLELTPDENGPLAALVFKTISDPYAGRLNIVRVFSGKITHDIGCWNATHQVEERLSHTSALLGKDMQETPYAGPGDIFAVPKLKDTRSGDTFCEKKNPVVIPFVEPPKPLMTYAAYPKVKGDEEKIGLGLKKIQDEDPTLRLARDEQTHELLVSCMGKLHIDLIVERIRRKYNTDIDLRIPKVPYRETIKGSCEIQGRHKKQSGGRGQFADTWIRIRPRKRGEGYNFVDKIVGGAIPRQYIPAVDAGVRDRMARGVIAGYPMVDVEVELYDGKYHDVDSSEMAFKIAGSIGFKKGAASCNPVLLEPIHVVTISVPEASLGDIIGDLNSRRGKVLGMEPGDGVQVIRALVPLSEIQEYSTDLRSITAGEGVFESHFDHYDEVPGHLAEKIIAGSHMEEDEE